MAKVDGSDMTNKQAITQAKQPQSLQQWVVAMSAQIKNALPATITPERMTRIALTALNTNKTLASCTKDSFLGSLLTAAQLGLEINTPLGQAYLIPRRNNRNGGVWEAQFQLGYQGLLELCYRTGQYKRIVARVVYEGDFFEYEYGLNERLSHKPSNQSKSPVAVYGLYELKNGASAFEVMTWKDVMAHKDKFSQSANASQSPWKLDAEAMAKKTVLKKVLKYAPKTVEVAQALEGDSSIITANAESKSNVMDTLSYTHESQLIDVPPTPTTQEVPQTYEASDDERDDDDDVAEAFNSVQNDEGDLNY